MWVASVDIKEGPVKSGVYKFCSNGGSKNASGNYATPTKFSVQPGASEVWRLERLIVHIGDTAGMQAQEYGNLGAALTNGIIVQTARDGVQTKDYTDGLPVKTNADWGRLCYDVELKTWGAGNEYLQVRWTFGKSGTPVRLVGSQNDSLDIVLEDNLSGLIDHNFMVQGYSE